MSGQADLIRDRRRAFAAPGGAHDLLVHRLANGLPAAVGVILAVMVITPLFPRSEVSFLLDRNKVAVTDARLHVANATYRGADDAGHAFSVSAGDAVQHSARVPVVQMGRLVAKLALSDGQATVSAPTGDYHIDTERMVAAGPVRLEAPDGYALLVSGLAVDMRNRRAFGEGGVTGALPNGTFQADRIALDMSARALSLDGHARLRMSQGKITVPH